MSEFRVVKNGFIGLNNDMETQSRCTIFLSLTLQAGIPPSQLMLALEPEVASVFVKEIQIEKQADEILKYRPGKKFLIMDLGGKHL